jgi:hypothetical protein
MKRWIQDAKQTWVNKGRDGAGERRDSVLRHRIDNSTCRGLQCEIFTTRILTRVGPVFASCYETRELTCTLLELSRIPYPAILCNSNIDLLLCKV